MKNLNRYVRIAVSPRLEPGLLRSLAALERDEVIRRIWDRDGTVWKPADREIAGRLGWLSAPAKAMESVPDLEAFARQLPAMLGEASFDAVEAKLGRLQKSVRKAFARLTKG